MKVQVILTPEESQEVFYDILCNAVSMGWTSGYGIILRTKKEDYAKAKEMLQNPCIEDVWMQILKNGDKLYFVDVECDGEYSVAVTLEDINTKIQNAPIEELKSILEGTADVCDDDIVLQHLLYGEVIFG